MKILQTNFGKVIVAILVSSTSFYVIGGLINMSHIYNDYISFPFILISPFLYLFLFLYLLKKIYKRPIAHNFFLVVISNAIISFVSYVNFYLSYHPFYIYIPFDHSGPREDFPYNYSIDVYSHSLGTFWLFIIHVVVLIGLLIYHKVKSK
jgi:hypothetical protein